MLNDQMKNEFSDFGRKMRTIAICTILLFIPIANIVALIIIFIKAIKSLGNIKRINYELNNKNLKSYRSFYLLSFVIFVVGMIIAILLAINLIYTTNRIIDACGSNSECLTRAQERINNLMIDFRISLMLLMTIVIFFMSLLQIIAWTNLNIFFKKNSSIFPELIAKDATKGSNQLKIAAIISLVLSPIGIFIFFIGVIGIIGFILQIIGYFNLSALRNLLRAEAQKPTNLPGPTPSATESIKNFCTNCGSPLNGDEQFCSSCGSKI